MSHRAWAWVGTLVLALGTLGAPAGAQAPLPELSIRCRLVTEFTGVDVVQGRILLTVTNHAPQPLVDVTLRLVDPVPGGRITGRVQQSLTLAPGETRELDGEFVLPVAALGSDRPLDWLVVYSDTEGFAHQTVVRGEAPTRATLDADAAARGQ